MSIGSTSIRLQKYNFFFIYKYFLDVERGKSFPRLDKLIAIMNTLECSADNIFEDVISLGYRHKETKLSNKIDKLSDKNKRLVFDVMDTLLSNIE